MYILVVVVLVVVVVVVVVHTCGRKSYKPGTCNAGTAVHQRVGRVPSA